MFDSAFFVALWPNFFATIFGGILLSTSFFFLKEWVFSMPSLDGVWECELIVSETAFNPYKGMKIFYRVTLLQEGKLLHGAGEKDREISASRPWAYTAEGRIRLAVRGAVQKSYTRSDVVSVHWEEAGEVRHSSTVHKLKVSGNKNSGELWGKYYSTAGECLGFSKWRRLSDISL